MATDLRWVLLIAGTLLVAGVYFYTLWSDKHRHQTRLHRQEPDMHTITDDTTESGRESDAKSQVAEDTAKRQIQSIPSKIIALHVQSQSARPISGDQLLQWAEDEDLVRSGDDESGFFVSKDMSFYVANILHPGTFRWAQMDTLRINGLSFFTQLPTAALTAPQVFENMRLCAVRFAEQFGTAVLDDQRQNLTVQSQRRLEQELQAYQKHYEQMTQGQS